MPSRVDGAQEGVWLIAWCLGRGLFFAIGVVLVLGKEVGGEQRSPRSESGQLAMNRGKATLQSEAPCSVNVSPRASKCPVPCEPMHTFAQSLQM